METTNNALYCVVGYKYVFFNVGPNIKSVTYIDSNQLCYIYLANYQSPVDSVTKSLYLV